MMRSWSVDGPSRSYRIVSSAPNRQNAATIAANVKKERSQLRLKAMKISRPKVMGALAPERSIAVMTRHYHPRGGGAVGGTRTPDHRATQQPLRLRAPTSHEDVPRSYVRTSRADRCAAR